MGSLARDLLSGPDRSGWSAVSTLDVVFPQERAVTDWVRRHAAGEVPGRWPYGLDELETPSDPPLRVEVRHLPAPGRGARLRARLMAVAPPSLAPALQVGERREAGLVWDENMAVRMALLSRYERTYAGVIWATDAAPPKAVQRALERLSAAWVLSAAQLEPLQRMLPGIPVHYVPFGVDSTFFSPGPEPQHPLIFSVGGDRDRDPRTTAEAFRLVLDARPSVRAVIQTPRQLDADPRIEVLEHLTHTQLRELYRQATVVAVATRPNLHVSGMTVSLEAMACGVPVVVTQTPGFEDYLIDGRTGALVRGGDPVAMADRIIDLIDNTGLAQQMGREGRAFVQRERSTTQLCARLRAVVTETAAP